MSRAYFLAPLRDNPPEGAIFLGSIIKSPRSPELSINGRKSPFLKDLEIITTSVSDTTRTLSRTNGGKAGVWAEFIDGIGIGGKVNASWDSVDTAVYKFDELITKTISPDFAELLTAFGEPPVQQAIKDSRFKDNIYMISGIKIAKGADVAISRTKARGKNFQIGLDTTPAGLPLKFGPDVEMNTSVGEELSEKHSQDFVFAYRLREISYKRKRVRDQQEYLKGELMGDGPRKGVEAKDDTKDEAELYEFREESSSLTNFDVNKVAAVDEDGEDVVCITFADDEEEEEEEEEED